MHPPISETDFITIMDETSAAAARLRRRLGLPLADLDDLRQDLLMDLLRRLPAFDARRGTIGAFAGILLLNQSARIAARIAGDRRAQGGTLLSLDVRGRDGQTRGDRLSEDDGLAAWHGQYSAAIAAIERRVDLARALGALSRQDRALCAALARSPVHHLPDQGFGSRDALSADRRPPPDAHRARTSGGVRQFSNRVSSSRSGRSCR